MWANSPSDEVGVLEKDVEVVFPFSKNRVFTIPKGVTVKNRSERGLNGIGQLENYRFSIIITSDDSTLVNYDPPKGEVHAFKNLYSGLTIDKDQQKLGKYE